MPLLRQLAAPVAAIATLLAWGVQALDVAPMVARLTPSGPGSAYRLSIKNTSATPVTIEIGAFRMEVDVDGKRSLTEEINDIVAFPPQSIIPPNREQIIQVRYVGAADIPAPRMYLIRAAQLPVDLAADSSAPVGAAVKVAFNINTHVFVSPPKASAVVVVSSAKRASNGDVLVVAQNTGSGIAYLREARYAVKDAAGREVDVPPGKVQLGQVSALPGGALRNMRIPADLLTGTTGEVSVTIQLL